MQQGAPLHHYSEQPPAGVVESCARTIASYAITLVTRTDVCDLPHELFPTFFVAGIMAQANLDNCRVILNEAKDVWDPGKWAMEIFDFLCANRKENAQRLSQVPRETQETAPLRDPNTVDNPSTTEQYPLAKLNHDPSFALSWDSIQAQFTGGMQDYSLMPTFLPLATDEWSAFQL
ncbi:hypothetical protein N7517_010454 [Penicillium concentricum]|uniref:Transcription factor domain-containing protein n=1 Tax=Penicillium concentricum TaxID=293559 RepID=A0A9W9RA73_9EURO|nr:uncharacterized protein N7517_010454 [Penicillium concentricum]KAJ5355845.1 hypothetical protein N7517_010454 [Penicillium concentricum]